MNNLKLIPRVFCLVVLFAATTQLVWSNLLEKAEHRYADNNGVKIHYVITGSGPLVVFIHGFPDYWYSWRDQMSALEDKFTVAACIRHISGAARCVTTRRPLPSSA